MAIYPAGPVPVWMQDQLEGGDRYTVPWEVSPDTQWTEPEGSITELEATNWVRAEAVWLSVFVREPNPDAKGLGGFVVKCVPQDTFFGEVIVLPQAINAGFILSTVNFTIDIYNSYKDQTRTLSNFVNNAGPGVTITDLPGLPTVIQEQDGFTLNLQISAEGPPINGTLDFVFDTITIKIPLVGTRSAVFAFEPVEPIQERLRFLTDVLEKRPGQEQRISLREAPRQFIEMTLELEGRERQFMESLVFSNQGAPFGLPIWWESTILTSAISATDTVIDVEQTDFRDFRNASQAIAWTSPFDFEVLEIDSFTTSSITFASAFQGAFPVAGTRIMPVRIAFMQQNVSGLKRPRTLQRNSIRWQVLDSDVDLSSTAAFSTFEGKVILDEENLISASGLSESLGRPLTVVDSETGVFSVFVEHEVSSRDHVKGFFSNSQQRLWEVRQLLHAFRGRQQSFFIPSFYDDLTPVAGISSAAQTINVENIGYNLFVQNRQPRDVVQVKLVDGTLITRRVESSSEISADEEQLTVTTSWGVTAALADIDRVSFVESVRLRSDDVNIRHFSKPGLANIDTSVVSVLG